MRHGHSACFMLLSQTTFHTYLHLDGAEAGVKQLSGAAKTAPPPAGVSLALKE